MIICLCRGVSDSEIKSTIREGACTLKEVEDMCDAGSSCGSCHAQILSLIREENALDKKVTCAIESSIFSIQRKIYGKVI